MESSKDKKAEGSATERVVGEIRKLRDRPDAKRLVEEIRKLKDRPDTEELIEEVRKLNDQ